MGANKRVYTVVRPLANLTAAFVAGGAVDVSQARALRIFVEYNQSLAAPTAGVDIIIAERHNSQDWREMIDDGTIVAMAGPPVGSRTGMATWYHRLPAASDSYTFQVGTDGMNELVISVMEYNHDPANPGSAYIEVTPQYLGPL